MIWTLPMDEELTTLRAEGLSCRDIARRMGVSTNAVIGRLYRLRNPAERGELQIGMRVRIKDGLPYAHLGRVGTVIRIGPAAAVTVLFDDGKWPSWHYSYFERT